MKVAFAKNLRELRTAAHWKQSDLAERLRTTQRKVSYWESGKVEPDLENLWKIADLFDITTDELIGRRD